LTTTSIATGRQQLAHLFLEKGRTQPDRIALGRRDSKGGPPLSYGNLLGAAGEVAAGLLALGLEPGDRVGVIADNSSAWLETDIGILLAGGVSVHRGADTSPSESEFILRHSDARFAIVEQTECARHLCGNKRSIDGLERVFAFEGTACPEGSASVTELRQRGRNHMSSHATCLEASVDSRGPEDLATIVYTSGTTAEPKGVMLTHKNLLHNIDVVPEVLHLDAGDLFLSILPSWHMFERILEYAALAQGAQIVYTDARRIRDDLKSVKPTVLAAVPRIWETIYKGILGRIEGANALKRHLLEVALELCTRSVRGEATALEGGIRHLLEKTLLAPFQAAVGGRLKLAVSGGGTLPAQVDEFFLALGIPLLNGYGLTETSPVVSVRLPGSNSLGTIGPPLPGTEVEIRDDAANPLPVGETGVICGPQIMKGYFKNPDATSKVIDDRGWFNSGDLGCLTEDGQLRITGRAKDTIVLSSGENVEPEPIESALRTSTLLGQVVLVGQDQKQIGALIVPNLEPLEEVLDRRLWEEADGVLTGKAVRALVRRELDRTITRANGFRSVDQIGPFRLLAAPFTREDGSVTSTLKIKRRVVLERHADLITAMY
jgi:long-chain acyl-CoA synthetase